MNSAPLNIMEFGNSLFMSGVLYTRTDETGVLLLLPEQLSPQMLNIVSPDLDTWKTIIRQLDIQEVEIVQGDSIKKAILRKSQRQIEKKISWRVFRRDHYTCRYCGEIEAPLTVDHIVLWEHGGPSIDENLLTSCGKCNKARGSILYNEWIYGDYYKRVYSGIKDSVHQSNLDLIDLSLDPPFQLRRHGTKRK